MVGSNQIRVCQSQMREIVQYWYDNKFIHPDSKGGAVSKVEKDRTKSQSTHNMVDHFTIHIEEKDESK